MVSYLLDNWQRIFAPVCFLLGHKYEPIGLFRKECAICAKRTAWNRSGIHQ